MKRMLSLGVLFAGCLDAPSGGAPFLVSEVATERTALDATPSANGEEIFFVEAQAILRANAAGVTTLHQGAPLLSARGIAASPTGETLYIADPEAGVFSFALDGSPIDLLEGSEGLSPTALDVQTGANGDVVFFTGTDPASGEEGVFTIEGASAPTLLFSSAEAGALDGIVVASSGTVFVADREAKEILSFSDGQLTSVLGEINTGSPAGLALSLDEETLLISSLDEEAAHSQVTLLSLSEQSVSFFDEVIQENPSGGGLHRAPNANVFAWAGFTSGSGTTVYRIQPQQ